MNLIKRITTSVSASMDNAVRQLENHEAVVEVSVRQLRQSIASTQAQLNRLIRQQTACKAELETAIQDVAIWTERAATIATQDKDKALACISQRNQKESMARDLKAKLASQEQLMEEINKQLAQLKANLGDLEMRKQSMKARQTVADVNRIVARCGELTDVENTFERWESVILENEAVLSTSSITSATLASPLEREFAQEEEREALEQQLQALLAGGEAKLA